MIFPLHCKMVGHASSRHVGDKVYFLSKYLLRESGDSYVVLEVELADGKEMMRDVLSVKLIAKADEVYLYPERVILHNRADLIKRAAEIKKRCVVFKGIDEHMSFIFEPDPSVLLTVHVYDVMPPRPHLSETLKSLEETGLFGELEIRFEHHVRDIREIEADVFPCRAGGFEKTIDSDRLNSGELVAGCMTARQILSECYDENFLLIDICPANAVNEEPFIARCCRSERTGIQKIHGKFGAVVHWGASPKAFSDTVYQLVNEWRNR